MKCLPDYQSSLTGLITEFIMFKRFQGYDYVVETGYLKQFDMFLVNRSYTGCVLQSGIMQDYCLKTSEKSVNTRAKLHSILRHFSLHLHVIDPQSEVLPESMVPRQIKKTRFYPLNPLQIQEIMNAACSLRPKNGLRPHCIHFLIGLLYSTGLRIAEALALNLKDVDENNRTLFVHRGKFGKDRIIPMSDSTFHAVEKWLKVRSSYATNGATAPLLIAKRGKRLKYFHAKSAFIKLCALCGMADTPPPRLHDLRHNYACRCIAQWREVNEDVNALLPVLSNAMGHVDFSSTQVYIHIDAEALRQASIKFNNHHKLSQEKTS